MNAHICLLLMAALPFWEAKPSGEWTLDEVRALLTDSPWAQMVNAGRDNPAPPVQIYLASAEPAIAAEDRLRAARKTESVDPAWDEYREYLLANGGRYIVLAIRVLNPESFLDNSETRHMEDDSYLRAGKRKLKVAGHFPPSSSDPYVRLVFPRELPPGDRSLKFDLYVPGAGSPYRQVEFSLKEMVYRGRPSY
jgi:hypothetical protein